MSEERWRSTTRRPARRSVRLSAVRTSTRVPRHLWAMPPRVATTDDSQGEALRLFERVTSYPVTSDRATFAGLRHQHAAASDAYVGAHRRMRYPAVALGDQTDLASHTSLGHPQTGGPTIFWFDNYEGGIGAAEKIYQRIEDLLEASWTTFDRCSCGTIEGCPYCTQLAQCDRQNEGLASRPRSTNRTTVEPKGFRQLPAVYLLGEAQAAVR